MPNAAPTATPPASPTPAPAAPVAPPPAPATPPAAPSPATPPANGKHPGVPKLMQSLFKIADEDKDKKVEKKKEEPPPAAPAPVAPPAAPEKPIRGKKAQRPELPKAPPAAPAPVAPPAAPATPPKNWEEDLEEKEKEMLETARDLEKHLPGRHKGLAAKTEAFIRKHIEIVNKPGFDPDSDEYKQFLAANQPRVGARDVDELREAKIVDRVRKENSVETDRIRHEMHVQQEMPKIKAEGNRYFQEMVQGVMQHALPPDVAEDIRQMVQQHGPQKGDEEARKHYALEMDAADAILEAAAKDAEEFIMLTRENPVTGRTLKEFDPKNEQHVRLSEMVADVCKNFVAANKGLQKDGKWFVTRDEWANIPVQDRTKYWTFNNEEILREAMKVVPLTIKQVINQKQEVLTKRYGFSRPPRVRQPAANPPPAAPSPDTPPPAPRPAPHQSSPGTPSTTSAGARHLAGLFVKTE